MILPRRRRMEQRLYPPAAYKKLEDRQRRILEEIWKGIKQTEEQMKEKCSPKEKKRLEGLRNRLIDQWNRAEEMLRELLEKKYGNDKQSPAIGQPKARKILRKQPQKTAEASGKEKNKTSTTYFIVGREETCSAGRKCFCRLATRHFFPPKLLKTCIRLEPILDWLLLIGGNHSHSLMAMQSCSRAFNYVVLGDTGKSHFRRKFCGDHFNMEQPVKLGLEYGSRKTDISGEPILVNIWEPASLESFRSLAKNYYQGATAAFLIYDVTNRSTFDRLKEWFDVTSWAFSPKVHFTLVATNTDPAKESVISTEEGKKFAEENNLRFVDIGRAEKQDVEKIVLDATKDRWERIQRGEIDEDDLVNGIIRVVPRTQGIARCF